MNIPKLVTAGIRVILRLTVLGLIPLQASDTTLYYESDAMLTPRPLIGENIEWLNFTEGSMMVDSHDRLTAEAFEIADKMPLDTMRWPGGTLANYLDWRKAIGPPETRDPQLFITYWREILPHVVNWGPDEAAQLAESMGGSLVICLDPNLGAAHAADFWEYMNSPDDGVDDSGTMVNNPNGGEDWAYRRGRNGHPAPYHVKYWEFGNELGKRKPVWFAYPAVGDNTDNGVLRGGAMVSGGTRTFTQQKAVRGAGNFLEYAESSSAKKSWSRKYHANVNKDNSDKWMVVSGGGIQSFEFSEYPLGRAPASGEEITIHFDRQAAVGWTVVEIDGDPTLPAAWASYGASDKVLLWSHHFGMIAVGDGTNGETPSVGTEISVGYVAVRLEERRIKGDDFETFFTLFKPVDELTLVSVDGQSWTVEETTADPADPMTWVGKGPTDQVVMFRKSDGKLVFGDGVTGAKPAIAEFVFLNYKTARMDGFEDYWDALKALDPDAVLCSGHRSMLVSMTPPYDRFDGYSEHIEIDYNNHRRDLAGGDLFTEYFGKSYFTYVDGVTGQGIRALKNYGAPDGSILLQSENALLDTGPAGRYSRADDAGTIWPNATRFSVLGGLSHLLMFERATTQFGEHVTWTNQNRRYPLTVFQKTGYNNQANSVQVASENDNFSSPYQKLVLTGPGVAQALIRKHFGTEILVRDDGASSETSHLNAYWSRSGGPMAEVSDREIPDVVVLGARDEDETLYFMGINTFSPDSDPSAQTVELLIDDGKPAGVGLDLTKVVLEDAVMFSDAGLTTGFSGTTPLLALNDFEHPDRIRIDTSTNPTGLTVDTVAGSLEVDFDPLTARVIKLYQDINDNGVKDTSESLTVFAADFDGSTVESDTDAANLEGGTATGSWGTVSATGAAVAADGANQALLLDGSGGAVSAHSEGAFDALRHRTTVSFEVALRHDTAAATVVGLAADASTLFELRLDGTGQRLYHVESGGDETFVDFGGVSAGAFGELPHLDSSTFDDEAMATISLHLGKSGYIVKLETPEAPGGWSSGRIAYRSAARKLSTLEFAAESGGGLWIDNVSAVQRDTSVSTPSLVLAGPSGSGVLVDWENRWPDARAFIVERAVSAAGPFREITRTDRSYYMDTNVSVGGTHHYRVRVLDADGDVSPWCDVVSGASAVGSADPNLNQFQPTSASGGAYRWHDAANWSDGVPDFDDMVRLGTGDAALLDDLAPVVEAAVVRRGASLEIPHGAAFVLETGMDQYWNSGKLLLASPADVSDPVTMLLLDGGTLAVDALDLQLWSGAEGFSLLEVGPGATLSVAGDLRFRQENVDADGYAELKITGASAFIRIGGELMQTTDNAGLTFAPAANGGLSPIVVDGDVMLEGALTIDESAISTAGSIPDEIVLIESETGTVTAAVGYLAGATLGTLYDVAISPDGKQLLLEKTP